MTAQKPRQIAWHVLGRRGEGEDFIENLLEQELSTAGLAPKDRALCQELTYGLVRWQAALDWLIARKTGGREQKPGLQILLRLGLYQLFWLDRIPDHAAVHETVELARQVGFGPQAGFLNAVLRGCLRERAALKQQLADLRQTQPALGFSHPDWLWQRWRDRFGLDPAIQLLKWNNTPARAFARVNTLRTDPGQLLQCWREREDVSYDLFYRDWLGENLAFELKEHPPLAGLESFRQGWFYVQDPSTLLAVRLLDPQPEQTVLDLCSAPGGKTTFIAQLMQNRGRLVAGETAPDRLRLVRENCARLGVTCVEPQLSAALRAQPAAQFDRVLVDAPCSNTGVMRRRVDLRWRLRREEIHRLRTQQLALLGQAAGHVKPDGILVYSTCSLEPEENADVITDFLQAQPGFELEASRELRPFADQTDGGFAARLRRRA